MVIPHQKWSGTVHYGSLKRGKCFLTRCCVSSKDIFLLNWTVLFCRILWPSGLEQPSSFNSRLRPLLSVLDELSHYWLCNVDRLSVVLLYCWLLTGLWFIKHTHTDTHTHRSDVFAPGYLETCMLRLERHTVKCSHKLVKLDAKEKDMHLWTCVPRKAQYSVFVLPWRGYLKLY